MADKNIEIQLKDVRLSYAHLFKPQKFIDKKFPDKPPRYSQSANFLIPKKLPDGTPNPLVKVLSDAMKEAIASQWPNQGKVIPPERRCVRDGEPIDPDTVDPDVPGSGTRVPISDGYAGCYFVAANRGLSAKTDAEAAAEKLPVQLLDSRKGPDGKFPRLTADSGKLYSGCYVDAIIRIYPYDGKGDNPDRINASLEAVKFKRHGDAFGAKPIDADSMFDEEEADDGFESPAPAKSAAPVDDLLG